MGLGAAITGQTGSGCSLCGNGLAFRPAGKEGQRATASCGWPWGTVAVSSFTTDPQERMTAYAPVASPPLRPWALP